MTHQQHIQPSQNLQPCLDPVFFEGRHSAATKSIHQAECQVKFNQDLSREDQLIRHFFLSGAEVQAVRSQRRHGGDKVLAPKSFCSQYLILMFCLDTIYHVHCLICHVLKIKSHLNPHAKNQTRRMVVRKNTYLELMYQVGVNLNSEDHGADTKDEACCLA